MAKKGNVYVVCAIDTEGPIDDARKPDILSNWERVDGLIDALTAGSYRAAYPDSAGKGLIYSWFILHLTGFKTNPFKRAMGYHAIYDHYMARYGKAMRDNGDGVYWHYHHPAPSGVGNEWCRDWTHCTEYNNILSHTILDRKFFPSCFRAGGRIEDDDLSNWIEQWIPFDFSSCSGDVKWDNVESDGKMLKEVCDWTRASREWVPYHPSSRDYQISGEQKRSIFRCPDLKSAVHTLSVEEIKKAFMTADSGRNAALAFFEHDRRMSTKDKIIDTACSKIAEVAVKFPGVKWFYKNAQDAARLSLGLEASLSPVFEADMGKDGRVHVSTRQEIFGNYPYMCTLSEGMYEEIPLQVAGRNKWISGRLAVEKMETMGVAANSPSGSAGVSNFRYSKKEKKLKKEE